MRRKLKAQKEGSHVVSWSLVRPAGDCAGLGPG